MAIGLGLSLLTAAAHAQNRAQSRLDFQQIRNSTALTDRPAPVAPSESVFTKESIGPQVPVPERMFFVSFSVPFLYNTNAQQVPGGAGSFEANPLAHLDWHGNVPALQMQLSVAAEANFDRYTDVPAANLDGLVGKARLQYVSQSYGELKTAGDDQEFRPFFQYGPQASFTPFLANSTARTHDLTIGIDKSYGFNAAFERLKKRSAHALDDAIWELDLTVTGTRRLSETDPASNKLHGTSTVTYNWDPQWSAALSFDIDRETISDGSGQENWTLTPAFSVTYGPSSWFKSAEQYRRAGKPSLVLQAAYNWIGSNVSGVGSEQWTFGPLLKTGWQF